MSISELITPVLETNGDECERFCTSTNVNALSSQEQRKTQKQSSPQ